MMCNCPSATACWLMAGARPPMSDYTSDGQLFWSMIGTVCRMPRSMLHEHTTRVFSRARTTCRRSRELQELHCCCSSRPAASILLCADVALSFVRPSDSIRHWLRGAKCPSPSVLCMYTDHHGIRAPSAGCKAQGTVTRLNIGDCGDCTNVKQLNRAPRRISHQGAICALCMSIPAGNGKMTKPIRSPLRPCYHYAGHRTFVWHSTPHMRHVHCITVNCISSHSPNKPLLRLIRRIKRQPSQKTKKGYSPLTSQRTLQVMSAYQPAPKPAVVTLKTFSPSIPPRAKTMKIHSPSTELRAHG